MSVKKEQLEAKWGQHLGCEFDKEYMKTLIRFLTTETNSNKIIYPKSKRIFAAFEHTPFGKVKVVILGQDPYHGPNQAHGLSFSVQEGVRVPPSLRNIYKELNRDLLLPIPSSGSLLCWADQGVLLLNSVLTVEEGKAGSHQKRGWEEFTDAAISALNQHRENLVFLLWGNHAIKKGERIDGGKHFILTSVHPSPLSAHRGFIGNGHFSSTNVHLNRTGQTPIDWAIPENQTSLF
ncbi:uracil-DNA glycosylase [Alphaproteobacteria bacterium 46_93_T64]|nr:uracil-DNA glycosylase [Alphaproteobacteria bacterium 46_93_T64]